MHVLWRRVATSLFKGTLISNEDTFRRMCLELSIEEAINCYVSVPGALTTEKAFKVWRVHCSALSGEQ